MSEAGSQSKYRTPQARSHKIEKCLTALVNSREENPRLHAADAVVVPDCGKGKDLDDKVSKAFAPFQPSCATQY